MGVNISADCQTFIAVILSGMICGILFDTFKVAGIFSKRNSVLISLFDLFFSLVLCVIVMTVFYIFNSYELRWFMFIGLFLGVILYFFMLSKAYKFTLNKLIQFFLKIFQIIFKILLTPARFLYKILVVHIISRIRNLIYKFLINRGISNEKQKKRKKDKQTAFSAFICGRFLHARKRRHVPAADIKQS